MPQENFSAFNIEDNIPLFNPTGRNDNNSSMHLNIQCEFSHRVRNPDDYISRTRKAYTAEIAAAFKTLKLKALSKDLKSEEIALWIKRRIEQKIPAAVKIQSVHIDCGYLDPTSGNYRFNQKENPPQKASRIFTIAANENKTSQATDAINDFMGFLYEASLQSKFADAEQYFSRHDAAQISGLLSDCQKTGSSVNFVTFICPPYSKTKQDMAHKNYNSIHPEFLDSPSTYNFDYNYYAPIEVMNAVQTAAGMKGINARSYIVFGDWGLICIDDILKTLKSENRIKENLALFYQGMRGYVETHYPSVNMASFQSIGAQEFMPIGLPFSSKERLEWLRHFSGSTQNHFMAYEGLKKQKSELAQLLKIIDDGFMVERILDWKNYGTCYASITDGQPTSGGYLSKASFVETAKVYGGIYQIRKKEEGGASLDEATLQVTSFIDTLIRRTQYQIYSNLFTNKYGKSVCAYFDPKFSSCGHFFRHKDMAVAFIDDNKIRQNPAPGVQGGMDLIL